MQVYTYLVGGLAGKRSDDEGQVIWHDGVLF